MVSLDAPPKAMKKSEMQQLTNESKKTHKINQWECRDGGGVVSLDVQPQGCEGGPGNRTHTDGDPSRLSRCTLH